MLCLRVHTRSYLSQLLDIHEKLEDEGQTQGLKKRASVPKHRSMHPTRCIRSAFRSRIQMNKLGHEDRPFHEAERVETVGG
jgi:hypothetical protein